MQNRISPLVSVVIPTYNREKNLLECIKSVVNQSYKKIEILICDDCSTDNTTKTVKNKNVKNLKVFNTTKNFGGPAKARNIGLLNARGKYVAFLDSDDLWLPNKIEKSISALEKGADLVYHDLWINSSCQESRKKKSSTLVIPSPCFPNLFLLGGVINVSSVVVKKDLMIKIGGFSELKELIAGEDYDAWLRLAKVSEKIVRIPDCLGFYSRSGNNLSNRINHLVIWETLLARHRDDMVKAGYDMPAWLLHELAAEHLKKKDNVQACAYVWQGLRSGNASPRIFLRLLVLGFISAISRLAGFGNLTKPTVGTNIDLSGKRPARNHHRHHA